jgi:hypothetical protein
MRIQPSETIYAPGYNVQTGEMIEAPVDDAIRSAFSYNGEVSGALWNPAASMNYFCLTGIFNDKAMAIESGNLAQEMYYMHLMYFTSQHDHTNPDLYADIGFDIWGYDCSAVCGRKFADGGECKRGICFSLPT